jgi:uncharacterized LabA/DUF88 family protein
MPVRSEDTYLFIDGEYLRSKFREAMQAVFGVESSDKDINFYKIRDEARAKRVFFYDCIDEEKKLNESDTDFDARVEAQKSFFSFLGSLKGFHVKEGTLRGQGKKRRQKEIDVLLATEMLTHGYDGNMETAILLAGDLDFRPAVESLVRRGVFVEVWYEAKSSSDLPSSADFGRRLTFQTLYYWATDDFCQRYQLPTFADHHVPVAVTWIKEGMLDGRLVQLMKQDGSPVCVLKVERFNRVEWYEHTSVDVLERYASTIYGTIEWSEPKGQNPKGFG